MTARRALAASALALLMPVSLLLGSDAGAATDPAGATPPTTTITAGETQRVRLQALPQIVQQGALVRSPDSARAAITATFKPVRVGRRVRLQVLDGSAWRSVAAARQDDKGRAQFAARASSSGQPLTYRVKAAKSDDLGAIRSDSVSTARWLAPTWTEEFSGSSLSPVWNHRGQAYSGESLRRCSRGDPSAVRVGGGAVRLSVMRDRSMSTRCRALVRGEPAGLHAYRLNGHIGTEGAFSFKYGVAAARVKFQRSRGQHGSFWMQPVGGMYPGSSGHEIDIIEYFGDHHPRGGLTTFIHRYEGSRVVRRGARITDFSSFLRSRRDGWSRNYHVFSVEWTPRMLVFRIDGKETFRIRGGISGVRQFPILSLLSSDYELDKMKDRRLPQHMYVDWVRVWETGSQ